MRHGSITAIFLLAAAAPAMDLPVKPVPGALAAAVARAEAARRANPAEPIVLTLTAGTHFLNGETLVIPAALSGDAGAPSRLRGEGPGVVVHAGRSLGELDWRPAPGRPGVWCAILPPGPRFEQLYHDGERLTLARYPDYDAGRTPFGGFVKGEIPADRVKKWTDPTGAYVHALHDKQWGGMHFRVTGVTPAGKLKPEGGWQNNRPSAPAERFVEGPLEELDAPGEWACRAADRTLFLMPKDGLRPPAAGWTVDGADIALALRGRAGAPLHDFTITGLRITGTARTFMDTREPLLLGDWRVARKAAVLLENTERVTLADTEFTGIGGNAVLFSNRNRHGAVERCHIRDAGAGGVYFVGSPASVRNPRFVYGEPSDSATLDRTPGPAGDDFPQDCRVSDCYMHDLGLWEKQVAGVHLSMASRITAERNTVHRVPRAAFNINDGTWGGHRLEGNDAWDTVRETGDHGPFNSWGRDRYWNLDGTWSDRVTGAKLDLVRSLAKLDAVEPIVLRGNRFDYRGHIHGWGIDLDDGSTNYVIENNLVTAGGIKLREGFHRTVRNNIVVGDTLHAHVWYRGSGDSITGNILGAPGYSNIRASMGASGAEIDRNLFAPAGGKGLDSFQTLDAARRAGTDAHSVSADPMFVDAAHGDYRLKPESPAFALGFKPFPLEFGTRVPAYAAHAAAERAAHLRAVPVARVAAARQGEFLGARVSEIDLGLRSVAGLANNDGLYLVGIPADSPLAKAGAQPGEVILALNGKRIKGLDDARRAAAAFTPATPFTLTVQDPKTQAELVRKHEPAR